MPLQARLEDSGKYLCWVNNTAGEETIQVSLTVTGKWVDRVVRDDSGQPCNQASTQTTPTPPRLSLFLPSLSLCFSAPLTAHLQPQVQTVDVDKDAQFQCIVSGHPVHDVNWLHDGKPILRDNRVEVGSHPSLPLPTSICHFKLPFCISSLDSHRSSAFDYQESAER